MAAAHAAFVLASLTAGAAVISVLGDAHGNPALATALGEMIAGIRGMLFCSIAGGSLTLFPRLFPEPEAQDVLFLRIGIVASFILVIACSSFGADIFKAMNHYLAPIADGLKQDAPASHAAAWVSY
ncbi:hypothetical protein RlegWSM1455_09190 [Rhizobium laguerreae]|uniref:hypothetical protein n=1 Tax=Rhizobium TaxID=379 RepID=UPI001C96D52A|nr:MULTISPECIES: hypothetical protein [Rhizobium]MBY5720224.1 hypothetical protein [Rhizobium leguminosarum]UFW66162.1 hypothetical protein RlegWSM1455_09190 [Rhizobium laguerreae]